MIPSFRSVSPLPGPQAGHYLHAQLSFEKLFTMTHGGVLLVGFVLVLVVAALVFLDAGGKPPVVPDEDSIRDRRFEDPWNARRNALTDHLQR